MTSKSTIAKYVAGVVGITMALSMFVAPVTTSAATVAELQAMIASLSAQLSAMSGSTSAMTSAYTFNTNLTVGSTGADVMNLQKVLNMSADTMVAASGAGSKGMETSTFGPATKAAVMKFQTKNGISPAAGYVGAVTRAKLNSMNTTTTTTTTPPTTGTTTTLPTGGALTVSAASQPANSLAPTSAARIPFTSLTLSAGSSDVTVNSITVERVGLAQDAVLSGVVLLNSNGMQIGIAKTLNSNHQALVGEPWVIKAGTSQTVTVAANMASSLSNYAGQIVGLNVVAVNTSASVSGSLPITGASHTVNSSLTLGAASMTESSFDPDTSSTREIGTTNFKFAGVRVTAGSAEQVRLWSIRWNQTGSASSADLANVKIMIDGTGYDAMISSDGKYYSATFTGGVLIDKGLSKDVYIQGDIVGTGAAGRTVKFDIYKAVDIYLSGVTYGYGITPTQSANGTASDSTSEFTSGTPFFDGSKVTVSAGTVTSIAKATSVAAQNVALNVPNQVLGGFTTDLKGEPISVQSMVFTVSTTTGNTWGLTNVTIVDSNGAVVAGPVDVSGATLTFTDTVTFPIGAKTYTLKGKLASSVPNGTSFTVSTTPSSGWTNVTGQTTGNTISLSSNGAFTMNTMTAKAGALAVTVSTNPAAQNIVAGGQGVLLANYQFDASNSGEDVRFSTLTLQNGGSVTTLTSCQLWDGSTALNTGSNVVNATIAATSFSFDSMFVVPKGTVKTLSLKCNVPTGSSGTMIWGITGTQIGNITTTGVTSGSSITASGSTAAGQTLTTATGSFTATIDSSTPSFALAAAGSTGVNIGVFKFRATNENVSLSKVGLVLTSGSSSDLGTVYLYVAGNTSPIGTATFTGGNTVATSTLNSVLSLAKDTDVLITIKADLGSIGTGQTGIEGSPVKIDVVSAEGNGLSSGNTLVIGGVTAGSNGVRMFKSFPVVSQDTLASTGVSDGKLMRFKITANSAGPVGLYQLNLTLATSSFATGGGVSAVKVMVYSDSSYSQAVSGTYGAATGQFGSTGTPSSNSPTIDYTATTNPLQIPANTTYYFQVESTVASTQTGTSVTATLNGDAAYIAAAHLGSWQVSSTTGAVADTNNDFIWSGNATSTAIFESIDWANGYGVLGLPSGGFSQTRSN